MAKRIVASGVPVLIEAFVVAATCKALEVRGWSTDRVPHTAARGVDITATKGRRTLLVEAKGAGSSTSTSARFGNTFDRSQVQSCVSRATYTALAVEPPALAGVAFPDTPLFQEKVSETVRSKLRLLGIAIFWVSEDGTVQIENPKVLGR